MHILLLNYTNFKNIKQFENLVFVIMSTRENIRLTIAKTSFSFTLSKYTGNGPRSLKTWLQFIYCWVIIFALTPSYIFIYMF